MIDITDADVMWSQEASKVSEAVQKHVKLVRDSEQEKDCWVMYRPGGQVLVLARHPVPVLPGYAMAWKQICIGGIVLGTDEAFQVCKILSIFYNLQ